MKGVREIWIEAEQWASGEWDHDNDNTDVIVTMLDGSRRIASFFTYSNIGKLRQKNATTGECLNGKYFWASDMILIDRVSRSDVEQVIEHLLSVGEFEDRFRSIPLEEPYEE